MKVTISPIKLITGQTLKTSCGKEQVQNVYHGLSGTVRKNIIGSHDGIFSVLVVSNTLKQEYHSGNEKNRELTMSVKPAGIFMPPANGRDTIHEALKNKNSGLTNP
ncbi:MAG: hypothetical protein IT242_11525 [Bacteroidia bacterium]|nr:hypothetical protein [Bacteroidia bacterium]